VNFLDASALSGSKDHVANQIFVPTVYSVPDCLKFSHTQCFMNSHSSIQTRVYHMIKSMT